MYHMFGDIYPKGTALWIFYLIFFCVLISCHVNNAVVWAYVLGLLSGSHWTTLHNACIIESIGGQIGQFAKLDQLEITKRERERERETNYTHTELARRFLQPSKRFIFVLKTESSLQNLTQTNEGTPCTAHSCSQHGPATACLTSERPAKRYICSKNVYSLGAWVHFLSQ